jgi:ADP-heptose:LPS heptosyltransferase
MALTRKRWPVASYRELIQRIAADGGVAVVVGDSADPRLTDATGGVVDLVGDLDLGALAALASMAAAYVGNDSGPTHLAEAAGAHVIMLFGPSDPIAYGPRSATSVALTAGLWCSPCFEEGRFPPCLNVLCMPGIGVDRVWRELAPLLARKPVRQ